jgi:hypothetical protein
VSGDANAKSQDTEDNNFTSRSAHLFANVRKQNSGTIARTHAGRNISSAADITQQQKQNKQKTNSEALNPQANYTERSPLVDKL